MKYFKPIDFEAEIKKLETKKPVRKPKPKLRLHDDILIKVLGQIEKEITAIKGGSSQFTKQAIHDDNIATKVLKQLQEYPSIENIKRFVMASKQDFGANVGVHFEQWLSEAIYEEKNERD